MISIRAQLKINKKLPKCKNNIQGPVNALRLANALGVQIKIVKQDNTGSPDWIMIDNIRFYFGGGDPSMHFIDYLPNEIPKNIIFLGDAFVPKSYRKKTKLPDVHINSPWGDLLWDIKIPRTPVKIKDRKGWCCLMVRRDPARDAIATQIDKLLDFMPNYFVYDMLDYYNKYEVTSKFDHLIPKMFRQIGWEKNSNKNAELNLCRWHKECLIEIVSETSTEIFTCGEKVYKPIAAGQLFVIIGAYKFLKRLRQMGFKTFAPYIDESYDDEIDMESRVEKAVEAVRLFLDKPIDTDAMEHLQTIVDHNIKRLKYLQQEFDYIEHVSKKLKKYIKF